jgi:6-phosphogluconolactonase
VNTHLQRFLHFADLEAASKAAAREIARTLINAVEARSTATLVIAGGSTPRGIHARLAERDLSPQVPWHLVHLFWGDERCVPPYDRNSNYAMARTTLLDRIEIPSENIHRIRGELPPPDAADRYEAELRRHFGDGGPPAFDCIMLGMGADGHTASLFPGDPLIDETERWVGVTDGIQASPQVPRVSMTLPVLNAARKIVFVVSGETKRRVVREIEERVVGFQRYPAARVGIAGATLWYIASESRAAPI